MPSTQPRRRQAALKALGVTGFPQQFAWLCKHTDRIGILTEGDSWFAYPQQHLLSGPNTNIIDHIVSAVRGRDKVNILRLESNGEEAVSMLAGRQKARLAGILKQQAGCIRFLLFSGGGNDVAGKWDMERLLVPWQEGFTARDCINHRRLDRKLLRIALAYEELLELRDAYAPEVIVVTHTYDLVRPADRGGSFLWGLIRTRPWIHPYLVAMGIPARLHFEVTSILLTGLRDMLLELAARPEYGEKFIVVDTQGTLRPGHAGDWENEIHPTPSGFRRIARRIWQRMREIEPGLPAMR